jgi:tRNA_anti-like
MTKQTKKKNPWRKRILIGLLSVIVVIAFIYWIVATDKFSDTKSRKADYTVNVTDFIHEFQQNEKAFNEKYAGNAGKIVAVNGRVTDIEAADTTMNIKMVDVASGAIVIFAFQRQHLAEAKTLKVGDSVSIKGACSGGINSDILGVSKIDFQRSTLNK